MSETNEQRKTKVSRYHRRDIEVEGGTGKTEINGVKVEITTKTPEPGTMTAIGLLGLGLAGAAIRRQLPEKTKTKV